MTITGIPMKSAEFSVATRRLTNQELRKVVWCLTDDARVYFDSAANKGGPREWPSYEAFLGFHIANMALRYQLDAEQLQIVVRAVYDREQDTCLDDREKRKGRWPASDLFLDQAVVTEENPKPWEYGYVSGNHHYWLRVDTATGKTYWNVTKHEPNTEPTPPPLDAGGYFDREALRKLKGDPPT